MPKSAKTRVAGRRAKRNITIDAKEVMVVHSVHSETAWIHTHGLRELGLAELEVRGVPRFLTRGAASVLNAVADHMLNGERTLHLYELIALDGLGVVQVIPAVPQEPIAEHYDHERWTVVDAPASLVECECCNNPLDRAPWPPS